MYPILCQVLVRRHEGYTFRHALKASNLAHESENSQVETCGCRRPQRKRRGRERGASSAMLAVGWRFFLVGELLQKLTQ